MVRFPIYVVCCGATLIRGRHLIGGTNFDLSAKSRGAYRREVLISGPVLNRKYGN